MIGVVEKSGTQTRLKRQGRIPGKYGQSWDLVNRAREKTRSIPRGGNSISKSPEARLNTGSLGTHFGGRIDEAGYDFESGYQRRNQCYFSSFWLEQLSGE